MLSRATSIAFNKTDLAALYIEDMSQASFFITPAFRPCDLTTQQIHWSGDLGTCPKAHSHRARICPRSHSLGKIFKFSIPRTHVSVCVVCVCECVCLSERERETDSSDPIQGCVEDCSNRTLSPNVTAMLHSCQQITLLEQFLLSP